MTNINPNNDVKRIERNIIKENKVNKKKEAIAQQKKVEASALNALSSYGKANVNFKGTNQLAFEEKKAEFDKRLKETNRNESERKRILYATTEETLTLAEKLCFEKDKWNDYVFGSTNLITEILRNTKPETLEFTDKICFDKKFVDKHIIPNILRNTSKNNLAFAEKLCFGKNEFGSELLDDKYIISDILRYTYNGNEEIINFAEKLCLGKDENGKKLFQHDEVINVILSSINNENLKLAEKLCFEKDENGKERFKNKSIIAPILLHTNAEKLSCAEEVCFNKEYEIENCPDQKFISLIYYTTNNNLELCKRLIQSKNYDAESIIKILKETEKSNFIFENDLIYADKDKQIGHTLDEIANFILNIKNNKDLNLEEQKLIIDAYLFNTPRNLKEKTRAQYIYKYLLSEKILSKKELSNLNLEKRIEEIEKSIKQVITPIKISNESAQTMWKGFFANNNEELDNLLTTSNFEKYGIDGLPLKYSRKDFLKELTNVLKDSSEEEKQNILKKLDISIIEEEGEITGYNGIINLEDISQEGKEGKVLALATKFIKENEINTGNKELDIALNSLIEGIPEFINIIGKQQHGTQDYSVDIHMLTVLKEAMKNPKYKELSNINKLALKISTVLHDIGKEQGIVDEGHATVSGLYVRDILNKEGLTLNTELKNRIYELVKNHHWLADYNKGEKSIDYTASLFRRTEDIEIARIMAEADLKSVSEDGSFYEYYKDALSKDLQEPIEQSINKINSFGQLFFTNKIINPKKVPTVEYQGNEYKVINFTKLSKSTDLEQFGFEKGTTVDNLRLFVHTTDNLADIDNVTHLSDSSNDGLLCASYISMDNHETYCNNLFGVSLEAEQANIANATQSNQGSGYEKTFDKFKEFITTEENRKLIPNYIKKELGLTDDEYAKLFKTLQNKKHFSQLDNIKEIKIDEKIFTGKEIKEVIQKANNEMLTDTNMHNEVNLYSPKVNAVIAKVNEIEEVPTVLLDFAKNNDYPIYLIGE